MSDKPLKPNDHLFAIISISEARQGNHGPLIARVVSGATLTADERGHIATILEANDGKQGKAALKRIEKALIALYVEDLVKELGSTEAAVRQVMSERGVSRGKVFGAMREYKKQK